MAETEVAAAAAARSNARSRPTINPPPRENFYFDSTTFSPGPMTLVSSLFSDTGCQSFSQLLAGAMASPAAAISTSSFLGFGSVDDAKSNTEADKDSSSSSSSLGFNQNRPVSLSIGGPTSPLFMIPPGLSPSGFLNSPAFFSSHGQLMSPFGMSHQQALVQVTAQATISQSGNSQSQFGYQPSSSEPADSFISNSPVTTDQQMQQSTMDANSPVIESSEFQGSDSKSQSTSIAVDKPAADGYNWRKYGQKQVKGSMFPRSYYKCTHIGCPVKKKVERSVEGQIIEIIYKGKHSHELPRMNNRGKDAENSNVIENAHIKPKIETTGTCSADNKPSACLVMEVGHDSSKPTLQLIQQRGSEETDDKVDTKEEGQCTTTDEQNPKRRQSIQSAPSQKTVTESRIVVQTRSEVDLLDDGFRWRKYGQKVVKGNPHPRSYYRCTTSGCSVRKHVERAAADPKAVITTYEGKHTHDIPLGKYGNNHSSQLMNPVKTAAQQTLPV